MKLIALSMVKNEEYWIWYSLTSVHPHVDEILLFDNGSSDDTLAIVRAMPHVADKLTIFEAFGGSSEQDNRERMLHVARKRGATHVLFLDGDEVHADGPLGFCRTLLEYQEHSPELHDPPENHMRPFDCIPTEGVLVKNVGMRPICPGFAGPDTCRPHDHVQPDTDHGCYNYAIRIAALRNLRGNGKEWGLHGYLETGDLYIQASPHTLWLPKAWYWHFSHHPRSRKRGQGGEVYGRAPIDYGSVPIHAHVTTPRALFRADGPTNPTLQAWGLRAPVAALSC